MERNIRAANIYHTDEYTNSLDDDSVSRGGERLKGPRPGRLGVGGSGPGPYLADSSAKIGTSIFGPGSSSALASPARRAHLLAPTATQPSVPHYSTAWLGDRNGPAAWVSCSPFPSSNLISSSTRSCHTSVGLNQPKFKALILTRVPSFQCKVRFELARFTNPRHTEVSTG